MQERRRRSIKLEYPNLLRKAETIISKYSTFSYTKQIFDVF
jgi:hypothetical protein